MIVAITGGNCGAHAQRITPIRVKREVVLPSIL